MDTSCRRPRNLHIRETCTFTGRPVSSIVAPTHIHIGTSEDSSARLDQRHQHVEGAPAELDRPDDRRRSVADNFETDSAWPDC
jgi:hypothetical protein